MTDRLARLRAALGAAAARFYPQLDERLWNRRRDAASRRAPALRHPPMTGAATFAAVDPHLVIITTELGTRSPKWAPGCGFHFFEIARTAQDLLGEDRVTIIDVAEDAGPDDWHQVVLDALAVTGATHLLANIENDPYDLTDWSWDLLADRLDGWWDGVFLGLMYDSAFEWTQIRAHRLARRRRGLLLVALDRPVELAEDPRTHVGPVLLPISRATQTLIAQATAGVVKENAVSFIGALYPYRVPVIDDLVAQGIPVAVNPQRPDETRTYDESRANQPEYLAYMAGLASTDISLNFSRANTEDVQQLKTRLIEASIVGSAVLTDDRARSDVFFEEGTEFVRFRTPSDAADVIRALLADRPALDRLQARARRRAQEIAEGVFWTAVNDGLARNGMRPLLDSTGGHE